ncbi:MAG: hypothetical protein KJ600_02200 [Nanoarchaeota archaeon]|nr:hypothetical protein [Nanoarchaeota archaeon]
MRSKIAAFERKEVGFSELFDIFKGWCAYAKWSDCEELEDEFKMRIIDSLCDKV